MSINLIAHTNRKSPISEAYRTLRTNIQFSSVDKKVKTIAVTSSGPSEGKTTTITNLAETFAQAGNRVIIVDSDLRRPCVHKTYGIEQNEGLTNVLAGQKDLKQVIRISESDVHIITSGPIPPNPSELLGSQKMQELIQVLEEHYDIVLFDAPPVNVVTDAAILSTLVDGIIFVVASGRTEIENGKHAMKSLEAVNANILGVVMTMIPASKKGYYGYSYYSYEQDAIQSKKKRRFLKTKNR